MLPLSRSALSFLTLILLVLSTASATAQTLLTRRGLTADEHYGASIAALGDVDGDGYPEFLVGGTAEYPPLLGRGFVEVVSSFDGSVLYRVEGDSAGDHLGSAVVGLGDVSGDGYPDFAAGAPLSDAAGESAGLVRIFSGPDGTELGTLFGSVSGANFGSALGAAEVTGDGVLDLLVGEPDAGIRGRVRVYSGADGSLVHTLEPDFDIVGTAEYSVAGLGDLDADGFDEIGAAGFDGLTVFSGQTGAVFRRVSLGYEYYSQIRLALAGDIDADGHDDILIGFDGSLVGDPGRAWAVSSATGQLIHEFELPHGSGFGSAVSGVGDIDGDGHDEFAVGASSASLNGDNSGTVFVFSGADGTVLHENLGDGPGFRLGTAIANIGDADQDGRADFLVAARYADRRGQQNAGFVRLYAGGPPVVLSQPVPGLVGVPNEIEVRGLEPMGTAIFLAKVDPGFTDVACTGGVARVNMNAASPFAVVQADASGTATVLRTPPTALEGRTFRFQVVESETCRISNLVVFEFPEL